LPAQITAYYVDSVNGSDTNSGTSEAAPWKTLAHVASATLSSNATIYLMRGETWNEQLTLPSSNLTVDAYGSGSAPTIDGSTTLRGSWTSEGSGLYSQTATLSSSQALGNISENGTLMTPLAWNTNATTTFTSASTGAYSFDNSIGKIYIKPAGTPSSNTYVISVQLYGILAQGLSNISINNIAITRFSLHGIDFENCTNCSVSNTTISSGGGAVIGTNPSGPPTYLYAGNGIQYGSSCTGGKVDTVSVSQIFDSGISPQTYTSSQTLKNLTIQNSAIDKCGFAGLEISVLSNGGSTGSSITGVTANTLSITNSGHGWSGQRYGTEGSGIRIEADSGAGTMSGISIQNSTVGGSIGSGVKLAGEIGAVTLNRLSASTNEYGVSVAEPTATTLKLILTSSLIFSNTSYGVSFNAPDAAGFEILQNTFYQNGSINLAVLNQAGTAEILNNLFSAGSAMTDIYVATSLAGPTVNNNCYTVATNMFGYNGNAYSTLATFTTATGFESHGLGGTVGLNNPTFGDFSLTSSSQCRGLGSTTAAVTIDYLGHTFASPPSSGAEEFQ
jgi:hypothetical protein